MQVRLVLVGGVGLDHQVDVVDVDAARRDIRRHQHIHPARREPLEVARALGLVEVAVESDRLDAGVVELLGEHLGVGAGTGEDEGLAVAVDEAREDLGLVAVVDDEHAVVDRARILVLAGHLVDRGLDEELVDERGDLAVEGGREQELLRVRRHEAQQALHRLEEPELGHVVGLIEHDDADLGEVELALILQVLDAPWRADDDVDALLQRAHLARLRHTAVHLGREQAHAARDRLDRAVDLQRELARGREDQRLRAATELAALACLAAQDRLDQRRSEGDRLARAGAATGEHVLALEDRSDRRGLDRERGCRAEVGQRPHDVVAEAELTERRIGDLFGLDGLCLQLLVHRVGVLFKGLALRGILRVSVPIGAIAAVCGPIVATRAVVERPSRTVIATRTVVERSGRTVVTARAVETPVIRAILVGITPIGSLLRRVGGVL